MSLARKNKYEYFIAGIIILLACFFRVFRLGIVPGAINQDSAMSAIDAKALLTLGTDHFGIKWPVHMKAWGYGQQSALLDYILIPFFKVGGISDFTLHLPMVLISMIGMIFLYLTARDLFGKRVGLIVLIITSFNPWHFAQSRWALDANLFPHVFMIGFYFLQKGLRKSRYLYISMIFFALCHYSYGISLYTVPVFLLISGGWLLINKQIKWKQLLLSAAVYAGVSLPLFITMFINTFKLQTIETPIITMPYFAESVRSQDILFFADNKWEQLIINSKAVINLILRQKLDILWDGIPQYGTMFLCMIPFFALGIYAFIAVLRREKDIGKKSGYVLVSIYALVALFSGFITKEVNVNRINLFHYAQIIFIAFGIYWIYQHSKWAYGAVIGLLTLLSVIYVREYFTDYAESFDSWETFSYNFTQALRDTAQHECEVYYITPGSQTQSSIDVSEIDTVYIHDLDSAYFMEKTNWSGGKELNPYCEQYQYVRASDLEINAELDAVYLINMEDIPLFSEELFHIEQYKQFCVVIPLKYYGGKNLGRENSSNN